VVTLVLSFEFGVGSQEVRKLESREAGKLAESSTPSFRLWPLKCHPSMLWRGLRLGFAKRNNIVNGRYEVVRTSREAERSGRRFTPLAGEHQEYSLRSIDSSASFLSGFSVQRSISLCSFTLDWKVH
jgi:hypothetical protein